ncbi:hypothetical protein [Arthrobacter mobilis]|uniref:Uncharacterized protein n=1 Tax=Arthrobacter mobilis TaxID=2724944 RepID=A0A7X6HF76_9MICC|nr:hypothetical protein [Arthrobacter mobilis]NKX55976.1 hypothetical protein [Arthrobacter mobilis]
MPFYLEYVVHGVTEIRSAVPGETLEEATAAATGMLREAGCQAGVVRWCIQPDEEPGTGEIVAAYEEGTGWSTGGSGPDQEPNPAEWNHPD